jgi:predicted aspartyl protease
MKFPYDTDYFPPAPSVEISLGALDEPFVVGPLQALVDTGADASIVPIQYIRSLRVQVDNRKYLRSQWGERRLVDTYLLDVGIGGLRLPLVEIVANEWGEEIILGRNVLNKLTVILDGPKQVLEIL